MTMSHAKFTEAKQSEDRLAELILPIMKGCPWQIFQFIDEHPGNWPSFYRERFWMLRSMRNHPIHSATLFANLRPD